MGGGINPEATAQFPADQVSTMTWHLFTERVHVPISGCIRLSRNSADG